LRTYVTSPKDDDDDALPLTPMALSNPRAQAARPGIPMEPGSWRSFRVDRYRLNDSGREHALLHALSNQSFSIRVAAIDGSIQTHSVTLPEISYALVTPFWGKAYPEEFQIAIQLWDRYSLGPPTVDQLILTGAIGLDCNGFVGGYMERRSSPSRWWRKSATKTSYYIKDLLGPSTSYLKSWDDLRPPGPQSLLLGLCDASGTLKDHNPKDPKEVGHLAITEPGTLAKTAASGPVKVDVLESTGPVGSVGLQRSAYTILSLTTDSAKRAIFYVRRGSKIGTPYELAHFRITTLR